MKIKSRLFLLLVFLLTGKGWAQTPTPIPTVIVNDVFGFGNTSATEVWVNDSHVQNPIPLDEYIKGVVYGEIGSWTSNTQRQNAFTAQAIAANTIWNHYYQTQLDRVTQTPGATPTITPIPTDTTFQVFNSAYLALTPTPIIENAVAAAGTSIITYGGNPLRYAEFSASTGASNSGGRIFTVPSGLQSLDANGNPAVIWPLAQTAAPNYSPYLRISPNTEVPVSEITPGAAPTKSPQVGMIQLGAFYLSESENYSPEDILRHYYHSTPPYVLQVLAYSGATVNAGPPISLSGGTLIYRGFWAGTLGQPTNFSNSVNNPVAPLNDMQFQIEFSERITNVAVTLVSRSNPEGIALSTVANPSYYSDQQVTGTPPNTWFGMIAKTDLRKFGSGPVTLQIWANLGATGLSQAKLNSYPGLDAMYLNGHKDYVSNTYFPGPDMNHAFNFKNNLPYLQNVVIGQSGNPDKYAAAWPISSQAQSVSILGSLKISQNQPFSPSAPATIRLTYSTDMDTTVQPTVKLVWDGGNRTVAGAWKNSTLWEADGINVSTGNINVPIELSVSGAMDLGGNPANADPYFIPFYNGDSSQAVGTGWFYGDHSGPATGIVNGASVTFWQAAVTAVDENFTFNKQPCPATQPLGWYQLDSSYDVHLPSGDDPFDFRVDAEGNIFVPQVSNTSQVWVDKVDKFGNRIANTESIPSLANAGFQDMALGPAGEVYILTGDPSGVAKLDPNFNLEYMKLPSTPFGSGEFTFGFMTGTTDPLGNPYFVSTALTATSYKMDRYLMFLDLWEQTTFEAIGYASQYNGIAYTAASNNYLYASMPNVNVVTKTSLSGQGLSDIGTRSVYSNPGFSPPTGIFIHPQELATDCEGNLYVFDDGPDGAGRIQVFNPTDERIAQVDMSWVLPIPPALQEYFPEGLAVDRNGNVYVGLKTEYFATTQDETNDNPASITGRILRLNPIGTPNETPTATPVPGSPTATPIATATVQATADANGVTVSLPGGPTAEFGANVLSQGTTVTISQYSSSAVPPPSGGFKFLNNAYDFSAVNQSGSVTDFGSNTVTLIFPYDSSLSPGEVANLDVQYYDSAQSQWVTVSATPNTTAHTLTVVVNHFSLWAVMEPIETPTPTATPYLITCPSQTTWTVNGPGGVAFDSSGNVYAVDVPDDQVQVFNSQGTLLRHMGGPGSGLGQFYSPAGIAVDSQGNVYVTDSFNLNVQVFNNQGNAVTQWTGFQYPVGIAAGPTTQIYVTDELADTVQEFDNQGNLLRSWGSTGEGGQGTFDSPTGVAVDSDGNVYVADDGTDLIQVFDGQGNFLRQWDATAGSELMGTESVAVAGGVVYVSDGFGAIGFFDVNGIPEGSSYGGDPGFAQPAGVAAESGAWAVADSGNNQVVLFGPCLQTPIPTHTPTPTFTPTITDTPTVTYTPTFPTTPVVLSCPAEASWPVTNFIIPLALDKVGNVYAGDNDNGLIDEYDSQGNVVTQFGASAAINDLEGVAVDGAGNVYVTDAANDLVSVFDSQGNLLRQWGQSGSGTGQMTAPLGIAVSPLADSGQAATAVYVADNGNSRVDVFDTVGNPVTQWGASGNGGADTFANLIDVTVDGAGNVYTADSGSELVQVFDSQGNFLRQWDVTNGTELSEAVFLSVDATGLVYVTDSRGQVGIFRPNGYPLGTISVEGQVGTGLTLGVAADNGTWYVVDDLSGLIYKYGICSSNGTPVETAVESPVATNTPTSTPTFTPTATATNTASNTATATPTNTATQTATDTSTDTATDTATLTATNTATLTATDTATLTATDTATPTATNTTTDTTTSTATQTVTNTSTDTATDTATPTATDTTTDTATETPTWTPTSTATDTATNSATDTATSTPTETATNTATDTTTNTATLTATDSATPTATDTPTWTTTDTATNTPTNSATSTPTDTPTNTPSSTATNTVTNTATNSPTDTATGTPTNTATNSPTSSPTSTATRTPTFTASYTATLTPTPTSSGCDLVDNFEDDNLTNALGGTWAGYGWGTGTSFTNPPTVDTVGADGTSYSVKETGTNTTTDDNTGFGVLATLNSTETAVDISSYFHGLSFWIKASQPATMRVEIESTAITDDDNYGYTFTVGTGWQDVWVPLSSFTQKGFGTPVAQNTALEHVLHFKWQTEYSSYSGLSFWVDEVCMRTDSATPTATPTSTPTVTPTPNGSLLNLEVWNPGEPSNQYELAVKITNFGNQPVALNRLSVKDWFYYTAAAGLQASTYGGNQTVYNADGSAVTNVNATAVTISSLGTTDSCGTNRKANKVAAISFTDASSVVIPANGGYVQTNADTNQFASWHRSDWANFDYSQDYSKITDAGSTAATRSNLSYFTLYLDGNLVCEHTSVSTQDGNTGAEPCNVTGCGGGKMIRVGSSSLSEGDSPTPTPTVTPETFTGPPVVAAPNISRGGEPINFLVRLKNPTAVHLYIFSLAGEEIFSTTVSGTTGENRIDWKLVNTQGSRVGSGLYIYAVDIADGQNEEIYQGKMVVIN